MHQFLQWKLRKTINKQIQYKELFDFSFGGKDYFGIVKHKPVGPMKLQRLQAMGIVVPENTHACADQFRHIQKTLSTPRTRVFIQLWITNILHSFPTRPKPTDEEIKCYHQRMHDKKNELYHQTALRKSIRTNMPDATVMLDCTQTPEELLIISSKNLRAQLNKAQNKWLLVRDLKHHEQEEFYTQRRSVAHSKSFHIIPPEQFHALCELLNEKDEHGYGKGRVVVVEHEWEIVAWGVCTQENGYVTYVYGFAKRDAAIRNAGAHHLLHFEMFKRAHKHGYTQYDLFGVAPSWVHGHARAGVSQFKESFAWTKEEYRGSYDLPLNNLLYKGMRYVK